ncbi:MAG: hypothetical protein WBZ20_01045 [Nitrososphaeraceae archaeon]
MVTIDGSRVLHFNGSVVYRLISKYDVYKAYIDTANPSFIKSLKLQIGEDADYDKLIATYRSEKLEMVGART